MKSIIFLSAIILALQIGQTPLSIANENMTAKLITSQGANTPSSIQGLKFLDEAVQITSNRNDGQFATIRGQFVHKDWSLMANSEILAPNPEFSVNIPIRGPSTIVKFTAVGPLGEVQYDKIIIDWPEWGANQPQTEATPKYSTAQAPENPRKTIILTTGLGLTLSSMTQTAKPNFSSQAITLKAGVQGPMLFLRAWDYQLGGFITALPIHQSPSGYSARFAGLNFRVGRLITTPSSEWTLTLFAGGYYATTWVNPNTFGYANIYGPQLLMLGHGRIYSDKALAMYVKLSPVTDGLSVLSLSTRELATGLVLEGFSISGHPVSYSLDLAHLALNISGSTISNISTTLGIGSNW